MLYLVLKALISGAVIAVASEVSRRSPSFGALIVALPMVSVLAMIWLWRDTRDAERLATHAQSTFWYVLPSLPMFLILPWLLRQGVPFWAALGACLVLTAVLYGLMQFVLRRFGYEL